MFSNEYALHRVEKMAENSWSDVVLSEEILSHPMVLVDAESLSMDKARRRLDNPMCKMQAVQSKRALERSDH